MAHPRQQPLKKCRWHLNLSADFLLARAKPSLLILPETVTWTVAIEHRASLLKY
jgi:hypothetical protein